MEIGWVLICTLVLWVGNSTIQKGSLPVVQSKYSLIFFNNSSPRIAHPCDLIYFFKLVVRIAYNRENWVLFCFPEASPPVRYSAPGLQQGDRGHALGPQAPGHLLPSGLLRAGEPPLCAVGWPTSPFLPLSSIKLYFVNVLLSINANLMNLSCLV